MRREKLQFFLKEKKQIKAVSNLLTDSKLRYFKIRC